MMSSFTINKDALLMGDSLYVEGIGLIDQPKVSKISRLSYDTYATLISPIFITDASIEEEYKTDAFSLFFNQQNKEMLDAITVALELVFGESVRVENGVVIIGSSRYISKQNYPAFQSTIMAMLGVAPQVKQKEPTNLNAEQKRVRDKLMYFREKHAKNNQPTFKEIVNTVVHKGNFSYQTVREWTYFQLLNSYYVLRGLDAFDEFLLYKVSTKFDIKEDMEHWTQTIKKI